MARCSVRGSTGQLFYIGAGVLCQWQGYGLDDHSSIPCKSREMIFSSPSRPNSLWGPSSLLSSGYPRLSPRKMSTHLYLVPMLRMCGAIALLPHMPSRLGA